MAVPQDQSPTPHILFNSNHSNLCSASLSIRIVTLYLTVSPAKVTGQTLAMKVTPLMYLMYRIVYYRLEYPIITLWSVSNRGTGPEWGSLGILSLFCTSPSEYALVYTKNP